jgi:hypothetical protein
VGFPGGVALLLPLDAVFGAHVRAAAAAVGAVARVPIGAEVRGMSFHSVVFEGCMDATGGVVWCGC